MSSSTASTAKAPPTGASSSGSGSVSLGAPSRAGLPWVLPEATDFGSSRAELHPLWVIETLKAQPHLLEPLRKAIEAAESPYGRKRCPGNWALVYLAFVFSGHTDVEPWWVRAGHSIWRAAGFRGERPSYSSTYRRFTELEALEGAFAQVAGLLIRRAVKASDGEVGRYVHIDSTEAQSHSRLIHDCPAASPCWKRPAGPAATRITATAGNGRVREDRHAEASEPEPADIHAPQIGDADQVQETAAGRRVKVGGCWYLVRDPDAGCRAYRDRGGRVKRFWTGYYNTKLVDRYTGATLACHVTAADRLEAHSYPQAFERLTAATGAHPSAIVADRGYSVSAVYEHNTRRGIASVFPWRACGARPTRDREDTHEHDRHGIPRCRACGAPTRFVRFQRESNSGPRLHVRCTQPTQKACKPIQTFACKHNWRMLLPVWRTEESYLALRHGHDPMERLHAHWRARYRVAGDNPTTRPKRIGAACQQLRASAAVLIEWLIICAREGWLASVRPLARAPRRRERFQEHAQEALESLARIRRHLGLHMPYGAAAQKLGIGQMGPVPGRPPTTKTAKGSKPKLGATHELEAGSGPAKPAPERTESEAATGNQRRAKAKAKAPPGN